MKVLSLVVLMLVACGDDATSPADTSVTVDTAVGVDVEVDASVESDAEADADTVEEEVAEDVPDVPDVPDVADTIEVDTSPQIDPNGDTDKDGIMDLDEVADLTDPFDPRSARVWHPEVTGFPRLFVVPADREAMRARADATEGSSKILWDRIVALANQTAPTQPVTGDFNTSVSPPQGRITEAAATVAWVREDVAMGTKALEILAAPFPDPTPLNQRSAFNAGDHYDLLEAEGLVPMCSAWDLLAGDEASYDPALFAAAKANLLLRIDYFRDLCLHRGGCKQLLRGEPNNHAIKAIAALALCAMALPDRPSAAIDFNEGVASMRWLFEEAQGNTEGGWAESWNYLSYSGESHIAFLLAWHHIADGATWTIRGTGTPTYRETTTLGKVQQIRDFAFNPTLIAVYQKALLVVQPDGRTPPTDDANVSSLHGGALAALFDDARFVANWELVGRSTGQVLVPTFFAFDPTMVAAPPDWPLDVFLPDAGFSVMKSDFTANALYVLVQHENGRMRRFGGAHEHADPLSFIVHSFGEPLIVDPGYIDFSNHAKVKYGKDHNIVLVDGLGPEFPLDGLVDIAPIGDAYLHSHTTEGEQTTLATSAKYAEIEVRRRFVRLGQRALVVADAILDEAPHTYTWQLNGYASEELGGTTFTRDATAPSGTSIATWQRPNARVVTIVAATEGTPTATDRLEESLNVGGNRRHRCLAFDAAMDQKAGFVALVVPAQSDLVGVVGGQGPAGTAWVAVGNDAAVLNRNSTPTVVDFDGVPRTFQPGLTIVDRTVGTMTLYTMVMPEIPDPEPFFPE